MSLYTTPAIITGVLVLLFAVERLAPLRKPKRALLRRLAVNTAISALAIAAAVLIVGPVAAAVMQISADTRLGIAHLRVLPRGLRPWIAFLLMDLSFYYWHMANHRIPLLWRFHNVHHIDPDLDVTTAFRFHFGEVALSAVFRVLQLALIGVSVRTFAVYELVFQVNTLFQHSNVRLPLRLERLLNTVLVTPRMHGVHHSRIFVEANANYSAIFSWWDRLHGTLRLNVPQSRIDVGIAAYSAPGDNTLWRALSLPFRQQRPYWHGAGDRPLGGTGGALPGPTSRMAE